MLYPKTMMQNWQELKASIVFFTTDARQTYEEMKQMPWGSYCRFQDPDGNGYLIKGE